MNKKELGKIIARLEDLPTLPSVVTQVLNATMDEHTSAADIAKLVSTDQALTAKVLRVANSAFYGLKQEVTALPHAIVVLGLKTLKCILLSVSVFDMFEKYKHEEGLPKDRFWEHSLGVAVAARIIAQRLDYEPPDEAFVAGILHDVGKIVLDVFGKGVYADVLKKVKEDGGFIRDVEEISLGFDHAFVGEWVAKRWGLPDVLCEAIAYHHKAYDDAPTLAKIVYLADLLCRDQVVGFAGDYEVVQIEEEDLRLLGFKNREKQELIDAFHDELIKAQAFLNMNLVSLEDYQRALQRANSELGKMALALDQANRELRKKSEDLKQAQQQLIQSARLSAIGELAGGVAHELNTPLAAILAYSQILQSMGEKEGFSEDAMKYLKVIEEQAQRCGKITRGLLDFAKQRDPVVEKVDINSIIEKVLGITEYELNRDNIKVVRKLDRGIPKVLADPNQLQQVILNLILNARQAMPEGGVLTLVTAPDRIDSPVVGDKMPHRRRDDPPDVLYLADSEKTHVRVSCEAVRIEIADTGCGIPKDLLERIFEPFVTTKHGGTGLGLSITYRIVQKHNGTIEVESKEGKGTKFIIKLPVHQERIDATDMPKGRHTDDYFIVEEADAIV